MSVVLLGGVAACDSPVDATDLRSGGAATPTAIAADAGGRAAGGRKRLHTIVDTTGLGGPALDVGVPPGWRVESAVRWDNQSGQCSYAIASPMFRMTSPDGRSSIEVFPGFLVTTSEQDIRRRGSQPGDFCILAMADSGEALAGRVAIPFLRPQARIQGMRQVALDPQVARIAQNAQQFQNPNMRFVPYTVETLLANPDGTMEKITLGGMISAGRQLMPGLPPPVLNQNFVSYAVRAPADQLAQVEALGAEVRASIRSNPDWKRQIEAFQNRMTMPVFARPGTGTGTRGGGPGNGGPDWMDRSKATADQTGATDDRIQEGTIRSIREEQQCPGPNGPITVSIHVPCPQ